MSAPEQTPAQGPDIVGSVRLGLMFGLVSFLLAMATPSALVRGPDDQRASDRGNVTLEGDFDGSR